MCNSELSRVRIKRRLVYWGSDSSHWQKYCAYNWTFAYKKQTLVQFCTFQLGKKTDRKALKRISRSVRAATISRRTSFVGLAEKKFERFAQIAKVSIGWLSVGFLWGIFEKKIKKCKNSDFKRLRDVFRNRLRNVDIWTWRFRFIVVLLILQLNSSLNNTVDTHWIQLKLWITTPLFRKMLTEFIEMSHLKNFDAFDCWGFFFNYYFANKI